jgi:PmbA protein
MGKDVNPALLAVAERCADIARKKGVREVAARAYKVRDVTVQWRDGTLEQINEATTRGVGLQLYVDGRYAAATSSDLRPEALDTFIGDSVAMTRTLAVDPFRSLPDPALYEGQAAIDLEIDDPAYPTVTPERRRQVVREAEAGARVAEGAGAILSVTTGFSDNRSESVRVHSNGFVGGRVETSFWTSAQVSVKDEDGRRPEDWSAAGVRFLGELPPASEVGRQAAERALGRLGAKKGESAVLPMVIENRAAGSFVGYLMGPLGGQSLQQKRSFFEGKVGQVIGSEGLTITDDPHLPRGFGSRLYDGEGIAARPLVVFEGGVLRNCFIDTYYGKKLKVAPTTGGSSNIVWKLGDKSQAELVAELENGILVTGFLGGNSNGTTGDFSLGVQGFRIRNRRIAEPVAEMNISGNHLEVWRRLVAVGNDPYPYSSSRTPALVFEGIQFAGV